MTARQPRGSTHGSGRLTAASGTRTAWGCPLWVHLPASWEETSWLSFPIPTAQPNAKRHCVDTHVHAPTVLASAAALCSAPPHGHGSPPLDGCRDAPVRSPPGRTAPSPMQRRKTRSIISTTGIVQCTLECQLSRAVPRACRQPPLS